jgi:4-amino-4-deoxy-L-arabinose transferase-like glycosyltransferase
MILTAASFLFAVAQNNLAAFAAAGLFGALGEWTKAFAFPFFVLCLLCVLLANLRRLRLLKSLAITLLVYAAVAGPWIGLELPPRFSPGK